MNGKPACDDGHIRLVFELSRVDHPRLFDDLIRFQKGTKRINRLRLLAYDGLLAQSGQIVTLNPAQRSGIVHGATEEGRGLVTNDLFAPSLAE